jgi:hypothetical protein
MAGDIIPLWRAPSSRNGGRLGQESAAWPTAALLYMLINTAKLNDVIPGLLADVLAHIAEHTVRQLDELRPLSWASLASRFNLAAYRQSRRPSQDHPRQRQPQVLRRIEVPLTIRLNRLHEVLQAAFGWRLTLFGSIARS